MRLGRERNPIPSGISMWNLSWAGCVCIEPTSTNRRREASRPEPAAKPVKVFYASVDGTGVAMVTEELEDRAGKQEDGSAKTREVKLGCAFTQQSTDEEGRPLRDPDSTTYVSSFAQAKDFGPLIRAEALRGGMALATVVVLLGDGALWIWELARTCFSFAVQVVDFFHASVTLKTTRPGCFMAPSEGRAILSVLGWWRPDVRR